MSALRFVHWRGPDADTIDRFHHLTPTNPLGTSAYALARERQGEEPWLFGLVAGDTPMYGALGFASGRRGDYLEIPSAPSVPADSPFWDGLWDVAGEVGLTSLQLSSFGSSEVHLPEKDYCLERKDRTEWLVALGPAGALNKPATNIRRAARKAAAAGMVLRVTTDPADVAHHLECVQSSMDRRRERGETVPDSEDGALQRRFLETSAGELALACLDGKVLSSAVVLRTPTGAYYQTAGTSAAGREHGASKFLLLSLFKDLEARGVREFNLGGAHTDNPGLQRYKRRFGARPVELEAALFSTVSPSLRKLKSLGRRARALLPVSR